MHEPSKNIHKPMPVTYTIKCFKEYQCWKQAVGTGVKDDDEEVNAVRAEMAPRRFS